MRRAMISWLTPAPREFAMKHAVAGFALVVLASTVSYTQQQPPTVRSAAAGVLVDVTVVDKDGRPVTDLTAADFDVSEDGKAQTIVSATLMRGGVPARLPGLAVAAATAAAPAPAAANSGPGAT